MKEEEFRESAHAAVEKIISYTKTLASAPPSSRQDSNDDTHRVTSQVKPGYLAPLIPSAIPEEGESFDIIRHDLETHIMPGIMHWQSPNFMAYFPANSSYPGILGDMYSDMVTCAAFTWQASPAVTELETIVMDMLASAIGLSPAFQSHGEGGGCLFGSASEAVLTMMMAARDRYLDDPQLSQARAREVQLSDLVVLISDQTHSGVEKAAKLLRIKCHKIATSREDGFALTADNVGAALETLRERGLHPFFICLTLGTTAICAVEDFQGLEPIFARKENAGLWRHLDAAYAGSALILPTMHHHLRGTELYDSFEMNPHKWLLTNFDCSCLWLRCRRHLTTAMDITPSYLRNDMSDAGLVTDYRNWGIPLGRRFRALKLWFVLRSYGLSGLRDHISRHLQYSQTFEALVRGNKDMVIFATPRFALCVVAFKEGSQVTRQVHERINAAGKLFLTGSEVAGQFVIRVAGCGTSVREEHLIGAYETLVATYEAVMASQ